MKVEQKPKRIPELLKDWNNKTEESYNKNGLDVPDNFNFQEKYFLSIVDADKYSSWTNLLLALFLNM